MQEKRIKQKPDGLKSFREDLALVFSNLHSATKRQKDATLQHHLPVTHTLE
jgi:hypothetical protein